MEERIMEILRDLVSEGSFTDSSEEKKAADRIYGCISAMDYFRADPKLCGCFPIKGDCLQRSTVYALVKGTGKDTVILTGHYDVVGIEDYGSLSDNAFNIDVLADELRNVPLSSEAAEDLNSGEWIFGRGAADMKAGLAMQLAYLERYSQNVTGGNILFVAVADEESYSAGMRSAVTLLRELKERYDLNYRLLINSEPAKRIGGRHIIPVGSGGKCMPVVLAQGEKAHIGMCFDGLNPIGLLAEIFLATELSTDFVDTYEGEATMPPTWNFFKDFKQEYDVSIPMRAGGYFSVLSFYTSPDEVLAKVKTIAEDCFAKYVGKMRDVYEVYKTRCKKAEEKDIRYEAKVMSFGELSEYCRQQDEKGFVQFYAELYEDVQTGINSRTLNYPQATIEIMNRVLDFSQINTPVIVIGFAPPYYPAVSGRRLKGQEGVIEDILNVINSCSVEISGVETEAEEYTVALSDMSYCAADKAFDYDKFSINTPLWGDMYSIDFTAIEDLNIPGIILGPWSKDYHQFTERVYKKDVTDRIPLLIESAVNHIFCQQQIAVEA